MIRLLSIEQHNKLTDTLTDWGASPEDIATVLADGVFGPGAVGIQTDQTDGDQGIGIIVDRATDAELDALFAWRASVSDMQLASTLQVTENSMLAFPCPHAPEVLLAYTVQIEQPQRLRRTFLLLMSKQPQVYRLLEQPGTSIWLTPTDAALRLAVEAATGSAYAIYQASIPIAQAQHGSLTIKHALNHLRTRA